MLNCTDLECILHHHHWYAYLHHKHAAQDQAMATDGSTTDITLLLNDTDSELSGLSHLDAPNDANYMICGVVIAMALVAIIIVLLALTISKLRKREEHSASVHPAEVLQAPAPPAPPAADPLAYRQQPLWQFPPPLPPPCVYTTDQDNLMQPIGNERASFRNLRKNLGGRWKKLVQKKPEHEVYSIPAELKPQLKQIYVY